MLDVRKIRLILELRESGLNDPKVLSAIEKIPRENFIPLLDLIVDHVKPADLD